MPVLNKYPIAYVLLWRNAHDKPGHFYMPYPGQKSVSDFVKFYNDKRTLFLAKLAFVLANLLGDGGQVAQAVEAARKDL